MGLDARVSCRCHQDGHAEPAPVPVHWDYTGTIVPVCGESGCRRAVRQWVRTGCAHPEMVAEYQRIGNWGSIRAFLAALHELGGARRFPALLGELSGRLGGGATEPEIAAIAVVELDELAAAEETLPTVELVDCANGEVIWANPAGEYIYFSVSGEHELGLGPEPTLCLLNRDRKALLNSRELIQARVSDREYCLTDVDTGQSIMTGAVLRYDGYLPRRIATRSRILPWTRFGDPVPALRTILEAAVVNQNPVRWC